MVGKLILTKSLRYNQNKILFILGCSFLVFTFSVLGYFLGLHFFVTDNLTEDNRIAIPVKKGNLEKNISASGIVSFPDFEILRYPVAGTIGYIYFSEEEYVKEGEILSQLDDSTIINLKSEITKLEKEVNDANEILQNLIDPPTNLDIKNAENVLSEAKLSEKEAEDTLNDYLDRPTELEIKSAENDLSNSKSKLEAAFRDLNDSKDFITGDNLLQIKALEDVNNAKSDLNFEEKNLQIIIDEHEEKVKNARENYENSLELYKDLLHGFFGPNIPEMQVKLSPDDIENEWGFKFSTIFESGGSVKIDGIVLEEDKTPWNESVVFAWTNLNPNPIYTNCDTSSLTSRCPESEMDDQWNIVKSNLDLLDNTQENQEKSIKAQENIIILKQETLDDLNEILDQTKSEVQIDEKISNYEYLKLQVNDYEKKLSELLNLPDNYVLENLIVSFELATSKKNDAKVKLQDLYKKDENEIALARSDIEKAESRLNDAKKDFDRVRIFAPFSGEIEEIFIEVGDDIQKQQPSFNLVDKERAVVIANVDEIDIMSLSVNDQVSITLDASLDKNINGIITDIGNGETNQGITRFPIEIEISQSKRLNLIEGLSASISIQTMMIKDVIMIPNQAVKGNFLNPTIDILIDEENHKSIPIELGESDEFWVIVKSGLNVDDKILMTVVTEEDPFQELLRLNTGRFRSPLGSRPGPPSGNIPPGR